MKMKSIHLFFCTFAFAGVALADDVNTTTDAKDAKDLKKIVEDQSVNYVETAQKGITLSGYVDVSYTNEFAGRGQEFNKSDENGNNQHTLREFDVNANGFNVQAVKIALEKALPDKNEWAAGFRVDTIYGQDAYELGDTAFDSSTGGTIQDPIAIEQALVKARIPVGNGLDLYAGKFVTFLGYEVIESPANLNFSRGLLFTNAIPLTTTGVYADYKFNDTVEAKFGIVDGWNNSVSSVSTDPAASYGFGGKAITGQVNVTAPGKNANICTSFIYSPDSTEPANVNPAPGDNGPSAVFDIWGSWNPTFVKNSALTLAFDGVYGFSGAVGYPGQGLDPASHNDAEAWWGIALYASYKFNSVFTLSGRGEYLHDSEVDITEPKFGFGYEGTEDDITPRSQDDFSYTLTAAFNIWANLLTRIEYRVDVLQGTSVAAPGYLGNTPTSLVLANHGVVENEVALEAVYSF